VPFNRGKLSGEAGFTGFALPLTNPRADCQVSAQARPWRQRNLEQRINTFASKTPFCFRIRSTNQLRPCYVLCSAWFLIALSMPEKIIA
jgi:hypothetical protein